MPSAQTSEWLLVLLCLPAKRPEPAGVLLLDPVSDKIAVRLKSTIDVEDETILLVWAELADDLRQGAEVMGGARIVSWLEETASHIIQISSRRAVAEGQTLEDLYLEHVDALSHAIGFSRGTGA